MPVNEFEKQVQQKMEDLKFTPSAEVWTEVEKRIRKEKRRRRIIFWWLLPGLLLGGSMAFYLINVNKKEDHFTQASQQVDTPGKNTIEIITAEKEKQTPFGSSDAVYDKSQERQTMGVNQNGLPGDTKNETIGEKNTTAAPTPASTSGGRNQIIATARQKQKKTPAIVQDDRISKNENESAADKDITAKKQEEAVVSKETITVKEEKVNEQTEKAAENTIEKKEDAASDKVELKTELAVADSVAVDKKEDKAEPAMTESPAPPIVKSKTKWDFGGGIRAGASGARWGSLLGGGLASFDASPSGQVGSGGTYTGAPVILKPPRNGFSFGVEFFAQRELSKRTELRIAVEYNYFSTHIQTGNRVDSNLQVFNNISNGAFVSNYYRPSFAGMPTREYSNRYHLAGISATLNWKLIRAGKFSMGWENGMGISRLLSTNALHYDRNRLAYYNDFEPFRKTQVLVSSGLSFSLLQQKKWTMSFHPSVTFGLTPVLKRQDGPSSHFLNYGAGLKFLFPRNK